VSPGKLVSNLCPSAQPGMDRCQVLGVVDHDGPAPVVRYLSEPVEASAELLATAAPLKPTEVLRLSATCAEHRCPHFDGMECKLVSRIVRLLPAVVDSLPPCVIRQECRWYSQEGGAACRRCPGMATVRYDLSPEIIEVSALPVFPRSDCERAMS
jgi:hypothetical protein